MAIVQYGPADRYAFVGKTRSGKTALAMVLAGDFARVLPAPWEVWWIDTKNDPKDLKALRLWGFRNAMSKDDQKTTNLPNAKYYYVTSHDKDGNALSTSAQCQEIFRQAYERMHVLLVVDEYKSVVISDRRAGDALLDVFTRGGGRNVGIIGLTQEPVYIPRQLLSQATHQVLLSLTHGYDIDYIKKMVKAYENPMELGDQYGFWWKWVDGNGQLVYYPNQNVWHEQLLVAMDRPGLEET